MDPFIGQILLFAFPRVPYGWHICDGSLLAIAEYDALFTLLGTTYGGDGVQTFALPDLRGRVPIHQGQGNGLTNRVLGEAAGSETVTLTLASLPAHPHALQTAAANPPVGAATVPAQTLGFATATGGPVPYATNTNGGVPEVLAAGTIGAAGGNQPHENMMPTLVMNYCIALYGIYPTQG